MFYLRHVEDLGASPDGRRRGESLGANFSVSLFAKTGGPLSVISSLTKPELHRTINGGPVTLEFASGIWSAEDSIEKFSKFSKLFGILGWIRNLGPASLDQDLLSAFRNSLLTSG